MNIALFIFLVLLDQITKYYALNFLSRVGSMPVIDNIFNLTYVENRGAAFGMLQNQKWFFVLVAIVVVSFIVYYLKTNKNMSRLYQVSLILILSGAIGNVIDRVRLNFVVDFFDFIVWPVFNMADIFVVTGGIILSYIIIFDKE